MEQRNVQAQAYVSTAIRQFRLKQIDSAAMQWFGPSAVHDAHMQKEIYRLLNSVASMLTNVQYVYPGSTCQSNTYAYVYPRGPRAMSNGKFVFHLCDYYMNVPVSEQIETLTHEGSHHATAFTDDVCMDEFYGGAKPQMVTRSISQLGLAPGIDVADVIDTWYEAPGGTEMVVRMVRGDEVLLEVASPRSCQTKAYGRGQCMKLARTDSVKAIRNADNLCYFIQDLTDQR